MIALPPAERLTRLPPYPFAVINQRVRELTAQGIDIISLDVGSPDMPPPDWVNDALAAAAHRPDKHGYAGYRGTASFRQAVARYYDRRFGVTVDPDRQVLPLMGSKEGIVNLSLAYLDRGDVALVPDIGYPSYAMGAYLAGAEVCWLPVDPANGTPDYAAPSAETCTRAKLTWVNYPNNPMGATVDLPFYQRALDFCIQHDILLASDNPYCEVTFDGVIAPSLLQADGALDNAIEFTSFSKTYNMAGWRLGAAVGSSVAIDRLLQVKSNMDSGHFAAIYDAGIAALDNTPQAWIDARNAVYQRRRDRIMAALPKIGLHAHTPKGALYLWGAIDDPGLNGAEYTEAALMQAHVSVAPGAIYGPGGERCVRLSVCTPDERLEEALTRLESWYNKR